eukprot:Nk52_evm2s54 gene=Nk52_evmTU2s54
MSMRDFQVHCSVFQEQENRFTLSFTYDPSKQEGTDLQLCITVVSVLKHCVEQRKCFTYHEFKQTVKKEDDTVNKLANGSDAPEFNFQPLTGSDVNSAAIQQLNGLVGGQNDTGAGSNSRKKTKNS